MTALRSVTMMEVIQRIPSRLKDIINNKEHTVEAFTRKYQKELLNIREIIVVASGSSLTSSITALPSLEKHTQKRVTCVSANEFLKDWLVFPSDALYIFVSQTGTSGSTRECQRRMIKSNNLCVAITEHESTPLSTESLFHIEMGSGVEEYGQRTIGYTTTVFTLTLLGIEIGFVTDKLDATTRVQLYQRAQTAIAMHKDVVDTMNSWFEYRKRSMMRARAVIFVGSSDLKGLALEGSVKLWETPQIPSFGYEIEEAMHSINYGMSDQYALIVFEGLHENRQFTRNFTNWLRDTYGNVYYLGSDADESHDLDFNIATQDEIFRFISYSAAMQVMNYRLAVDGGRNLLAMQNHEVMNAYFRMHGDTK